MQDTIRLNYFENWYNFTYEFEKAFFDASIESWKVFSSKQESSSPNKIQKTIRKTFDQTLRSQLKEERFIKSLRNYINANVDIVNSLKLNEYYRNFADTYAKYDTILELIRDKVNRTPSEIISVQGKFNLHHYKSTKEPKFKTPLLIVGSLINRHYILDLLPEISVIRNLQEQGFDVYATDWRTPSSTDKDFTLETFGHEFLEKSIDKIKEITKSEKISLMGYCWGGIFALIYSTIHPENVKNLVLHATPTDLGKDKTVIGVWTKNIQTNNLVSTFGNVPPFYLNLAFIMRNPVEAFLKYLRYFSEPRTAEEINQFFSVEMWLYDSPPVIGNVFSQIIDDIYKHNLLIKNKMMFGNHRIDLKKINMSILNIFGTYDDLVPPESSKGILDAVASADKKEIEFPTGHVGLCISSSAHEKLWPQVGKWLSTRS